MSMPVTFFQIVESTGGKTNDALNLGTLYFQTKQTKDQLNLQGNMDPFLDS